MCNTACQEPTTYLGHLGHTSITQSIHMETLGVDIDVENSRSHLEMSVNCRATK